MLVNFSWNFQYKMLFFSKNARWKKIFPFLHGPAWHEAALTCSGTFSSEWKEVQATRGVVNNAGNGNSLFFLLSRSRLNGRVSKARNIAKHNLSRWSWPLTVRSCSSCLPAGFRADSLKHFKILLLLCYFYVFRAPVTMLWCLINIFIVVLL